MIKGSIGLIHAVTSFVQDWMQEQDRNEKGVDPIGPGLPDFSISGRPLPEILNADTEQTATEPVKKTRESAKAKKEREEREAQEKAAAAQTPEIPLPGWLNAAARPGPTDPVTVQAVQSFQPLTPNPFGTAVAEAQQSNTPAWAPPAQGAITDQPWIVAPVAQEPAVSQGPGLQDLLNLHQTQINTEYKRTLLSGYLLHLRDEKGAAAADIASIPKELYTEAYEQISKIGSGAYGV